MDANAKPITLTLNGDPAQAKRRPKDLLDTARGEQILLSNSGLDCDVPRKKLPKRRARTNIKPIPSQINIPPFIPQLSIYLNIIEMVFGEI